MQQNEHDMHNYCNAGHFIGSKLNVRYTCDISGCHCLHLTAVLSR